MAGCTLLYPAALAAQFPAYSGIASRDTPTRQKVCEPPCYSDLAVDIYEHQLHCLKVSKSAVVSASRGARELLGSSGKTELRRVAGSG